MSNPLLSPQLKRSLARLLPGRPEILFAVLYGSAAAGQPFRDLDIGLFADRARVPPAADIDYASDLADALEAVVLQRVDVRVINDAPPGFRRDVSRGIPAKLRDHAPPIHNLPRLARAASLELDEARKELFEWLRSQVP